jgi:hypothetical protein
MVKSKDLSLQQPLLNSCAVASQVDAIVTRDISGFVAAEIPVISPDELNTI